MKAKLTSLLVEWNYRRMMYAALAWPAPEKNPRFVALAEAYEDCITELNKILREEKNNDQNDQTKAD